MSSAPQVPISAPRGTLVALIGCGGGAGASTIAASLALAALRCGRTVAVVDLDATGGGLDVVFGIEREPGVRWSAVAGADGELDGAALFDALPAARSVRVLLHGRELVPVPDRVVAAAIGGLSSACDLLLFDAATPAQIELVPLDVAVVVVAHGTVRGTAAAAATVSALRAAGRDPSVVLRDVSTRLAAQFADVVDAPVLARVGTERRVERAIARGVCPGGRGELAASSDELLDLLIRQQGQAA